MRVRIAYFFQEHEAGCIKNMISREMKKIAERYNGIQEEQEKKLKYLFRYGFSEQLFQNHTFMVMVKKFVELYNAYTDSNEKLTVELHGVKQYDALGNMSVVVEVPEEQCKQWLKIAMKFSTDKNFLELAQSVFDENLPEKKRYETLYTIMNEATHENIFLTIAKNVPTGFNRILFDDVNSKIAADEKMAVTEFMIDDDPLEDYITYLTPEEYEKAIKNIFNNVA